MHDNDVQTFETPVTDDRQTKIHLGLSSALIVNNRYGEEGELGDAITVTITRHELIGLCYEILHSVNGPSPAPTTIVTNVSGAQMHDPELYSKALDAMNCHRDHKD